MNKVEKKESSGLPRVGVYLTADEFKAVLERHKQVEQISGEEKLLEIRFEGRIGYRDLQKLLLSQKKAIRDVERKKWLGEINIIVESLKDLNMRESAKTIEKRIASLIIKEDE